MWHGGADFAEGFDGGAVAGAFVFGEGDGAFFAGFGVFDGGGDGDDFVVEPACFLGYFGAAEGFRGVFVLLAAGDVEVVADVFGCLDHGLHAVCGVGVSEDVRVEGLVEAVAA